MKCYVLYIFITKRIKSSLNIILGIIFDRQILTSPQKKQQQCPPLQKIRNLIVKAQLKCQSNHKAIYICINKNCQKANPFICTNQDCQCSSTHEICPQMRHKSFSKVLEKKGQIYSLIIQKINDRTDKLIDKISDLREIAIKKLKNGKYEEVLGKQMDQNCWKQHVTTNIKQDSLNGQLMNQILQSDQKIEEQKRYLSVLKSIEQTFDSFTQQVKISFQQIFTVLLKPNIQKFYWSHQLKGFSQQIAGRTVKKTAGSSTDRFTLLEPSLNKLKAQNIQWQINVIREACWVGLGICFRHIIQKNNLNFTNYSQAQHGSYLISSNGYTWTHQNPAQNSTTSQGLQIKSGNVIAFELDMKNSVLKFTNKNTEKKGQIPFKNNLITNDLHICSCLGSEGDEVQIIDNMLVDGIHLKWDDTGK